MNSRNVIRAAVLGVICAAGAAGAPAQVAPAAKIGVVNLRLAIATTAEGKQALAEFESRFTARQKELDEISRKINDLSRQLEDKQSPWSDEQKAKAQVQGQRLMRQLERKQSEFQQDRDAAKLEIVDRIGRKMLDVVDRYSREHNLGTVFDSSSQNSPVLFAATTIDITQPIAKLYDQAYPVKAAAAPASKPATTTPKPAAPRPTKP